MSPSSPLYEGPQQPPLSISQPEVSELELSCLLSLIISNLFHNALVAYESSNDAETPVPHPLEDTAEGPDDVEPDTSVALPPIPSMLSLVSLNFSLFQLSNSSFSLYPLSLNLVFLPPRGLASSKPHLLIILLTPQNIHCQECLWKQCYLSHPSKLFPLLRVQPHQKS